MAQFMLDLYDNDKVVGIVDGLTYNYELKDPLYNFAVRQKEFKFLITCPFLMEIYVPTIYVNNSGNFFSIKFSSNIPHHRHFITIIHLWTMSTINPYFLWQRFFIYKIKSTLFEKNTVSYVKEITLLTFIFVASSIT